VALGCWCAPKRCHGESIKRLIESALDSSASIVFMGGSISIKALPDDKDLLLAIDNAARSAHIVIGDAPGADAAIQWYLYKHGYRNVTVYYRGSQSAPRNNIGGWKAIAYGSSFVDKDIEMSRVCNSGLFLWDRKSKGTKSNIDRLRHMGKPVLVFDQQAITAADVLV